jgi:putative transcriptional regulator
MAIVVEIDVLLAKRKMSVGDFAEAIGLSPANVSVLKNGRARAVRFSTLNAICEVLGCQPGDVLRWVPDDDESGTTPSGTRRRADPVD